MAEYGKIFIIDYISLHFWNVFFHFSVTKVRESLSASFLGYFSLHFWDVLFSYQRGGTSSIRHELLFTIVHLPEGDLQGHARERYQD
jgi:hypothetical protein